MLSVPATPAATGRNGAVPTFNGATGENADPPIEWGEDLNVKWKIALPGLGHSTPAVWEERIYVLSAKQSGVQLQLYRLPPTTEATEATSGTKQPPLPPRNERGHRTNTLASRLRRC